MIIRIPTSYRELLRVTGRALGGLARRFSGSRQTSWDEFEGFGGIQTDSGEVVNHRTAYTVSSWFRAQQIISSQLAKTSICLWDRRGKSSQATKHFAWKLLCGHGQPNPETYKFHFIQTLTAHAVGHGGGFAYIRRNDYGHATELIQLRPDRTYPVRENGVLKFVTSVGGDYGDTGATTLKMLAENVLHIHGLGWDGLTGYSVTDLASRALGCAIAKERFGAQYFSNGVSPSVTIEVPKKLTADAYANLKESWHKAQTGVSEAHKAAILEEGAKAVPFSHSASDAQLIEACEQDPVIVSNFTGVPPHLLGVKGYHSNSTLETQTQNLLDYTIDPWMIPWEQALNGRLLRDGERESGSHEFKFLRKELIRVDAAKRSATNRTALGGHPFKTINEVREEEDLDPLDEGDFIPMPLNMGQLGDEPDPDDPATLTPPDVDPVNDLDPDKQRSQALQDLWKSTAARMSKRLQTSLTRNADQDEAALLLKHGEVIREAFGPLLRLTGTNVSSESLAKELCERLCAEPEADGIQLILNLITPPIE